MERRERRGGRNRRGKGGKGWAERGTTEQRHPSHAVAAQLHFATSILPARLHSHSVDPFTEGMSHMPSSSLSLFPLLSLRTPAPRHSLLLAATPYGPCLRQSRTRFSFYLIPSIPFLLLLLLHPSSPNVCPRSPVRLPPSPLLPPCSHPSPLSVSLFSLLSRSLVHSTKVSLFLSDSLLCDAGR